MAILELLARVYFGEDALWGNLSFQMVLLKSRIILMYDVLGISSKTMATLKSSVFVCLQRLCPGVCSKGLPERSLDTELVGGCVAGRIRNTQCSRLLVGHFFLFLAWVFFPT